MRVINHKRIELFGQMLEEQNDDWFGKHICAMCENALCTECYDGTKYDMNWCDKIYDILYGAEGFAYKDDKDKEEKWEYFRGNDRKAKNGFGTVDCGGGYFIVSCPLFEKIDFKKHYYEYILTNYWKKKRDSLIKKRGYKCELCGSAKNIQVHHISYERLPNEDERDLLVVCKACHEKLHESDLERKQKA